jgi:hypothetical protein
MKRIYYKKGYKYQLTNPYSCQTQIIISETVKNDYITLTTEGEIYIQKGYAWDGPSGLTIDTKTFMRASLVHDALYQLMRETLIDIKFKAMADKLLKSMCREDGMVGIRSLWVYVALRLFGRPYVRPEKKKPVIEAPKKPKKKNE